MKKLITLVSIITVMFLFSGCYNYEPNYTYKWDIKVTYNNGDVENMSCGRDSFKGNKVKLYLSSKSGGLGGSGSACIYMKCGAYNETITCGVRKFEIISETKTELKK